MIYYPLYFVYYGNKFQHDPPNNDHTRNITNFFKIKLKKL